MLMPIAYSVSAMNISAISDQHSRIDVRPTLVYMQYMSGLAHARASQCVVQWTKSLADIMHRHLQTISSYNPSEARCSALKGKRSPYSITYANQVVTLTRVTNERVV